MKASLEYSRGTEDGLPNNLEELKKIFEAKIILQVRLDRNLHLNDAKM